MATWTERMPRHAEEAVAPDLEAHLDPKESMWGRVLDVTQVKKTLALFSVPPPAEEILIEG